jgi:hypothetical protein
MVHRSILATTLDKMQTLTNKAKNPVDNAE